MILIDPPVGPFSPVADIEHWLAELRAWPEQDAPEVREAIEEAERWLAAARVVER